VNIVVIGMGEVGCYVAKVLAKEGHDVVAVDTDIETLEKVSERMDVATVLGYGASPRVLRQARVHEADLVVGCTDNDEVNLIAALASKRLGAGRTVARLQSGVYEDDDDDDQDDNAGDGLHHGMLGIDLVVNAEVLVAHEMVRIARSHGALDVHMFADNRLELAEVEIPADSGVLGHTLSRLDMPEQTRVGAVIRGDVLFVPGGSDILQAGDRVYLFGLVGQMHQVEDLFCHGKAAHRVAIYGGETVGKHLAQELSRSEVDTLLICEHRDKAERLSISLPLVTVVHGDGTDMAKLEEEGIGGYDLYCALTEDDENNLMSALLAKRLGTPRAACIVHRHAYTEIYRQLGIDVALSPRQIAADHILGFVRPASVESLVHLGGEAAQVMEIIAALDSPITNKPVAKLSLPKGVFLGGIVGTDGVRVPTGDDRVEPGDTVVVLYLADQEGAVKKLFKRSLF
jgi:trk system potassium uptake protein TrkA